MWSFHIHNRRLKTLHLFGFTLEHKRVCNYGLCSGIMKPNDKANLSTEHKEQMSDQHHQRKLISILEIFVLDEFDNDVFFWLNLEHLQGET